LKVAITPDPNKMEIKGYFDFLTRHSGARISPWGEKNP
jgi:hypothetical protein